MDENIEPLHNLARPAPSRGSVLANADGKGVTLSGNHQLATYPYHSMPIKHGQDTYEERLQVSPNPPTFGTTEVPKDNIAPQTASDLHTEQTRTSRSTRPSGLQPGATSKLPKPVPRTATHGSAQISKDNGARRNTGTSGHASGDLFKCDKCAKEYRLKSCLARQMKDCGTRVHNEGYRRGLEEKIPTPETNLICAIARIEARSRMGQVSIKQIDKATDLTFHQIRHRREKSEYNDFLEITNK